jgi:hypothetical protein
METRRWVNQSQPQTLYLGTILLYIEAVTGLLFGSLLGFYGVWLGLAGLIGMAAAGFGIANERRWGWLLGVGVSGAAVLAGLIVVAAEFGVLTNFGFTANFLFTVALFVLLVHPQSRDYQRIWFK